MDDKSNLVAGPIPAHLRRIAVPYAVGMVFAVLYSLVDTFFAGLLSTNALAALAISFPIFFVLTSLGMGINAAATALVGNALGAADRPRAKRLAAQCLSYALGASIVLALIGLAVAPPLAGAVSNLAVVRELTVDYLHVLFLAMPAFFLFYCANGILLAQGNAIAVMRAHIANLGANIVLTPLMVFGIPGAVDGIGFVGIALATLVAQTAVTIYALRSAVRSDVWRLQAPASLRPKAQEFREISGQALPTGIALALIIFSGYIVQIFLRGHGAEAIAAFGIAIRIEQLLLLPGIALAYALRPVISQNYGAARHDRVREALACCCRHGAALMAVAGAVLATGGRVLLGWFSDDAEVVRVGGDILLVLAVLMPFTFLVLAVNSFLQGIKRSSWVLAVILYERLFGLVGLLALFTYVLDLGIRGVWYGMAAGGVTGFLLAMAIAMSMARTLGQAPDTLG